jgi:glycerophosphoryl diester phosphodiesterase
MVHHDDVLGRVTEGEGRLDSLPAAALKRVPFHGSNERMMTLGELCDLVAGRVTLLVEIKSRFDGDSRLPARVADVLAGYGGPVAPMSFDPRQLVALQAKAPQLTRGIVAAGYSLAALTARPQFVAYGIAGLPALAPLLARHVLGMPLLTWTIRTQKERQRAQRWADQMIFEGFRP